MLRPLTPELLAPTTKCLSQRKNFNANGTATKNQSVPIGRRSMAEMNWRKRAGVLLSILVLTLMDLSINKARAGEQTNTTGLMDEAWVLPRPAATLQRSTVPMAGGLAPQP